MAEVTVQRLLEELVKQESRGKSQYYKVTEWQGKKYKLSVLRLNPKGSGNDFEIRVIQMGGG